MHVLSTLRGCVLFAFAMAATAAPPLCKKDLAGSCHPKWTQTFDSYTDNVTWSLSSKLFQIDFEQFDDLTPGADPYLYGGFKYVDFVVGTAPANTQLIVPSGNNYFTVGPGGALRNGQAQFQTTENSAYLDYSFNGLKYACSGIGGSPAVPCTIRVHLVKPNYVGGGSIVKDLVYKPVKGYQNIFANADFTSENNNFGGYGTVWFELLSADTPTTQILLDNIAYNANIYK